MTLRHIVGVADMKVSKAEDSVIVTHALGSCLGLAIFDPEARVGGILHAMLPVASLNPEKAAANPYMFVDTGVPAFFKAFYALGGDKRRVVLKAAGCGEPLNSGGMFKIGRRNYTLLKKLIWKNGVMLSADNIGDTKSRTMYLYMATGQVMIQSGGVETEL